MKFIAALVSGTAWSPDGRRIAFASNCANVEFEAFDIYVAERDGSNPTPAESCAPARSAPASTHS